MSDYDKEQWQAEQKARDAALDKQRERETKARERSARNAKRKLERLRKKLKDTGEITEWEDEFSESVTERLDEFGSAFNDREKGRPGDALSFAQKRVVASMNKKVKEARKAKRLQSESSAECNEDADRSAKKTYKKRSSFKSKKPKFTPRVRNLEDDMPDAPRDKKAEPFIPEFEPETPPMKRKPFLRIVKNDEG